MIPQLIMFAMRNRQPAATLCFTFIWMRLWYQVYTLGCYPGILSRAAKSFNSALENAVAREDVAERPFHKLLQTGMLR